MSILLADAPTNSQELPTFVAGILLIWLLAALASLKPLGIFRRGSIDGPQRVGSGESIWIIAFILFASYFLCMSVGGLILRSHPDRKVLAGETGEVACAALLVVGSAALRPDGLKRLGLTLRGIPRGLLTGATLILVIFPLVGAASEATSVVLKWTHWPEPKPHPVLQSIGSSQDWKTIAMDVVLAVVIAPVFEELVFRGFLQTMLGRFFRWVMPSPAAARWLAVICVALLFAAEHQEPAFMPALMVLAIGLGYTYERTGNLWATMTAHAIFNSLQIVLYVSTTGH